MKKDDILIIRIVSVAVLIVALALIIILGVRYDVFDSVIYSITNGNVVTSDGSFPLYASVYYSGMNTIYTILFALLMYSVITSSGILFKLKGSPVFAVSAAILGIITGVFLLLSKILEDNIPVHRLFAYIYLRESTVDIKTEDMLELIPVRVAIFGVLLIIACAVLLVMIKKSLLCNMKKYKASDLLSYITLALPIVFGTVYIDNIRRVLMQTIFSNNATSEQIYSILSDYYLDDMFFISSDALLVIILSEIIALVLYNIGIKKKFVKYVVLFVSALLSLTGVILFYINPPRLFGYLTLDEAVCDTIEITGAVAVAVMVTDILLLAVLTSVCMDMSKKISHKKILIITAVSMIISIISVCAGVFIPITALYIIILAVNIITLIALLKFTYVS